MQPGVCALSACTACCSACQACSSCARTWPRSRCALCSLLDSVSVEFSSVRSASSAVLSSVHRSVHCSDSHTVQQPHAHCSLAGGSAAHAGCARRGGARAGQPARAEPRCAYRDAHAAPKRGVGSAGALEPLLISWAARAVLAHAILLMIFSCFTHLLPKIFNICFKHVITINLNYLHYTAQCAIKMYSIFSLVSLYHTELTWKSACWFKD